jgi:hypothetical protein
MRTLLVVAIILSLAGIANAQPGQPVYSQPPPAPYSPPPPSYGYGYERQPVMPVQLTVDEQWLLQRGFISDGEALGGGAVALFFGLGIGHVVQGRWSRDGYIFTFGELGAGGLMMWGMVGLLGNCFEGCSEQREDRYVAMVLIGAVASGVFRIWEIYDAFSGPSAHNRKLFELRSRLGMPTPMYARMAPYVAPNAAGEGGGVAGLSLRF